MGRKKLESLRLIQDKNNRNLTYSKRKRGLIKKAIELAIMCDQQICLVIYDKEKMKLTNYCSTGFDST